MERKIERQLNYKKYKRKMNSILFLLILPAILLLGSFLVLYLTKIVSIIHLGTVYIPLMIVFLMMVLVMAPKLSYNKMYADYTRLLLNEPLLHKNCNHLFTTSWIEQLKNDGYELVQEDMRHMLLCKHHKKLPGVAHADPTLVFIVIAKVKSFDFYGDEVDNGTQAIYMKHKEYEKIDKRITLQFKKYDTIDDKAREEVETAILYQAGKQALINLTFVYCEDTLMGLNPGDWYPNRYAYFAFTEYKRICDIKE